MRTTKKNFEFCNLTALSVRRRHPPCCSRTDSTKETDDEDDERFAGFVDNLDRINALAESSPGFIWRYVSTDNAYVQQNIVEISPEVGGRIVAVMVEENQQVEAGDILT